MKMQTNADTEHRDPYIYLLQNTFFKLDKNTYKDSPSVIGHLSKSFGLCNDHYDAWSFDRFDESDHLLWFKLACSSLIYFGVCYFVILKKKTCVKRIVSIDLNKICVHFSLLYTTETQKFMRIIYYELTLDNSNTRKL